MILRSSLSLVSSILVGILTVAAPAHLSYATSFEAIPITLSVPIILPSLYSFKALYLGRVWSAQPWCFVIEGYMSLPDLTHHVFGVVVVATQDPKFRGI